MALCDIALIYDPVSRRCDHAFNGIDLALDFTARTPVLVALGCDRFATQDDVLPDDSGTLYAPTGLNPRRGSPIDALAPSGRRTGSRLWLMVRRKQTEATRRFAETAAAEALDGLVTDTGLAADIKAEWIRRGILGLRVIVGDASIVLSLPAAA